MTDTHLAYVADTIRPAMDSALSCAIPEPWEVSERFSAEAAKALQEAGLLRDEHPAKFLDDPNVVHINMLRGGIAKLTPEQIGHLYRGQDAIAVVMEVIRQNPDIRWAQQL